MGLNLASCTAHKAGWKTGHTMNKTNKRAQGVKDLNAKPVWGRAIGVRHWSDRVQLLALTASGVQAVKDLGSVQKSIRQSLGSNCRAFLTWSDMDLI